MYNEQIRFLN